jgi:hypothetical protein
MEKSKNYSLFRLIISEFEYLTKSLFNLFKFQGSMNYDEEQMRKEETKIHSKYFGTKQSREKEKVFLFDQRNQLKNLWKHFTRSSKFFFL